MRGTSTLAATRERAADPPIPELALRRALDRTVLDSLSPVLFVLTVLYAVYGVSHLFLLPPGPREVMSAVAFVTAALFAGGRLLLLRRRPPARWGHPLGALLVGGVLVNCHLHLLLMREPRQTTNLMLVLVGAGFLLLDWRWFAAVAAVVVGGWLSIIASLGPDPAWVHFGFAMFSAAGLAVIVQVVHARRLRRLETLHLRDRRRRFELERAVADAEAASRAKGAFLATMSHELRTPLNAIIGFANVLGRDFDKLPEERGRLYLDRIASNGRLLLEQVERVLELTTIRSQQLALDPAPVELGELVAEVVAELRPVAEKKGLWLRAETPTPAVVLETDRARLRQVLTQLVENGLKFTDEGGVSVTVHTVDGSGRPGSGRPGSGRPGSLAIADTGVGIPRERIGAVFEPFEQGEGGLARRHPGSGVGLAVARFLCEMMGYRLTVESEPGTGSVFRIHFGGGDPASPV